MRLSSKLQTRFFFQPVQFHFEPADLIVEFVLQRFLVLLPSFLLAAEAFLYLLDGLLLPLGNLGWMHLVTAGNLIGGKLATQSFESHFGFEFGCVSSSFAAHFLSGLGSNNLS